MASKQNRTSYHIELASKSDLEAILALQKEAYLSEAERYDNHNIPPLLQTQADIDTEYEKMVFLKIQRKGTIVGSVRAYEANDICHVGKLMVSPKYQNKGIGTALLLHVETHFPTVEAYELFTGHRSDKNLHLYKKLGYAVSENRQVSPSLTMVFLRKENRA